MVMTPLRTIASPAFLRSTSIVVTPSSRSGAALHRPRPQWHSLQCHFFPAKWRRGRAAPTTPSHASHMRGNIAGGTNPASYPRASSYAFALAFKLHDCNNSVPRHRTTIARLRGNESWLRATNSLPAGYTSSRYHDHCISYNVKIILQYHENVPLWSRRHKCRAIRRVNIQ